MASAFMTYTCLQLASGTQGWRHGRLDSITIGVRQRVLQLATGCVRTAQKASSLHGRPVKLVCDGDHCFRSLRGTGRPFSFVSFVFPSNSRRQEVVSSCRMACSVGSWPGRPTASREADTEAESARPDTGSIHAGRDASDSTGSGHSRRNDGGDPQCWFLGVPDPCGIRDGWQSRGHHADSQRGLRRAGRMADSTRLERQDRKDALFYADTRDYRSNLLDLTVRAIVPLALVEKSMLAFSATCPIDSDSGRCSIRTRSGRSFPQVSANGRHIVRGEWRRRRTSPWQYSGRFRAALPGRAAGRQRSISVPASSVTESSRQ